MPLIHHQVNGIGAPPIVFVHGFGCDHTDWDAQVAALSPRHQIVAVDLRGHGASPASPADCSIERYGADVAEVMRALVLPPAILVGHSMGCRVVMEAALQAPEHVAGVVLVDGSQFAPEMAQTLRAAFAQPNGFATLVDGLFTQMFAPGFDKDVVARCLARAHHLPRAIGEKMMLDLQRYDVTRLEASLASLRVKVMAIQSTFTNFNRQRVSLTPGQTTPYLDLLRRHLPGIRVEVVPATGHFPQLEQPGQTSELLASFAGALR